MELTNLKQSTLASDDLEANQMDLLINILRNNGRKLKSTLQNNRCDINYIYGVPFGKPVLEIACFELAFETKPRCIEILLEHGANAEAALSSAAFGGNPKILRVILKHLKKNVVDLTNNTVIISLINYVHDEDKDEENYAECVKLLLQCGVNVNVTQTKSTCNAIYLAAKYNLKQIIAAILTTNFDKVDLDSCIHKEFGSARDMIIMNKLYDGTLPVPIYTNTQHIPTDLITLVQYIKHRKEMTFIMQHRIMKAENKVDIYGEYVLLLCATEEGCLNVVRYLLCIGVNPNCCNAWNKLTPIRLAVVRGYYHILKILIQYSNTKHISDSFVTLLQAVCLDHKCLETMNINHKKCFELLLQCDKLNVNFKKGELSDPALHFAIKNQTPDVVMKILRKGASLALLRLSDRPWTVFVSPEVLQTHLDECITISRVNEFTNEFTLMINYSSLLPIQNDSGKKDSFYNEDYFESEPFVQDSNDKQSNLALTDTKVLEYICNKTEFASVLHHPLIHIFLYLHSLKINRFCVINFFLYFLFIFTLMTYIYLGYNHMVAFPSDITLYFCFSTLTVFLICLITRELIQMYIYRYDYLKNYENYLEIILLITTVILLCVNFENTVLFNQISSLVIVLSTIELLLMSGRNLLFTSITMLTTVSLTFLKLLLPYFILVMAFAFSFFILFQNGNKDSNDKDEFNFFSIVWTSILKTTVMLTGEFESGNLDFLTYPYASSLLFLLFMFHMNIVLFGVFTALAISDTQKIIDEAETQSQIFRIKHICYWEKIVKLNKLIAKFPTLKQIMKTYPHIEIVLTKDSKVYTHDIHTGKKTEIKLGKKIICAIRKLVEKKNNTTSPFFKKCPVLRYPNLNDRQYYVIHGEIKTNMRSGK